MTPTAYILIGLVIFAIDVLLISILIIKYKVEFHDKISLFFLIPMSIIGWPAFGIVGLSSALCRTYHEEIKLRKQKSVFENKLKNFKGDE